MVFRRTKIINKTEDLKTLSFLNPFNYKILVERILIKNRNVDIQVPR
jgi:hypothetical protein